MANLSWLRPWGAAGGPPPAQRARTDNEEEGSPASPLVELPTELWAIILSVVSTTDDPCAEIVNRCEVNRKWAALCQDGRVFDEANRRLGWYGTHQTLVAARQHYANAANPPPMDTPRAYFNHVCRERSRVVAVMKAHAQAMEAFRRVGSRTHEQIQIERSWVERKLTIKLLRSAVNKTQDDAIAMMHTVLGWNTKLHQKSLLIAALQTSGTMLSEVPGSFNAGFDWYNDWVISVKDRHYTSTESAFDALVAATVLPASIHPDYTEFAKVAVRSNGLALRLVPWNVVGSDAFLHIVRLAIPTNGRALRYLPGSLGRKIPRDTPGMHLTKWDQFYDPGTMPVPDYANLAMLAVSEDGTALAWVPTDLYNYGQLRERALRTTKRYYNLDAYLQPFGATTGARLRPRMEGDPEWNATALSMRLRDKAAEGSSEKFKVLDWRPPGVSENDDRYNCARIAIVANGFAFKYTFQGIRERAAIPPEHQAQYDAGISEQLVKFAYLAVQENGLALKLLRDWGKAQRLEWPSHNSTWPSQLTVDERAKLCKLAVQENGLALEFVPTDRDDFGDLARIAVQENGLSLFHVPGSLKHTPDESSRVFKCARPDFWEIVKLAVKQNGMALKCVNNYAQWHFYHRNKGIDDKDIPFISELDYIALAKIAVQENGMAMKFVDMDFYTNGGGHFCNNCGNDGEFRRQYFEIAKLAILQTPDALEFVWNWYTRQRKYDYLVSLARAKDRAQHEHEAYVVDRLLMEPTFALADDALVLRD